MATTQPLHVLRAAGINDAPVLTLLSTLTLLTVFSERLYTCSFKWLY